MHMATKREAVKSAPMMSSTPTSVELRGGKKGMQWFSDAAAAAAAADDDKTESMECYEAALHSP